LAAIQSTKATSLKQWRKMNGYIGLRVPSQPRPAGARRRVPRRRDLRRDDPGPSRGRVRPRLRHPAPEGRAIPALRGRHPDRLRPHSLPRPRLELRLGAENVWDDVFFERWRTDSIPRYRPTRAFLFEIPVEEVPVRFEDTLFQMELHGLLPVMAHPERYAIAFNRLAGLAERIPLVVDLGAVAGYHGPFALKTAHKLLHERLAHAAATDVHTPSDVRAALEGIAWIKKKLGADAAARLLDENPRRILAGELPDR